VKELCDEFGATYVTRVNRSGAKAGNINHALTVSSGEFIGVVDADFIPAPDYIEQMLGYFQDVNVAIVQAPQEFYNVDSFQHGRDPDGRWQEQSMF
jgi:cellulose synthase (UDP-forming)